MLIPWPHLCRILERGTETEVHVTMLGASSLPPCHWSSDGKQIKEGEDAGAAEVVGRENGKKAKCAFCQKVSKVIF